MIVVLTGLHEEADIFRGQPGLMVLCGATQRDNLANLVPTGVTALVSAGCAGGLSSDLKLGDLTVASKVYLLDNTLYVIDTNWTGAVTKLTGAAPLPFFSCPTEQCATAAQRATLRAQYGTDVVDEESWAVAQVALARKLPFLVLRTISDTADETLPPADSDAINPDGSENIGAIIEDVFKDPSQIGGLIRDGKGFEAALDSLRKAFSILGPSFGLPTKGSK